MTLRRLSSYAFCALIYFSNYASAADYRTENFIVTAPTKQLAETFGKYAEKYRVEKAREWLGKEMPRWSQPCPLVVEVSENRTGGATTFTFSHPQPGVMKQDMKIFGPVNQMLESVLPHEVTHTVLAHHFGQAVPRWADEGGSVLSENDKERLDHDIKCREFLNAGRGIPLRVLFPMKNYPRDMIVLYAQGYSVSNYLIDLGGGGLQGRRKFLEFLETGMQRDGKNWEAAIRAHYGYESLDDLQVKWIDSLRKPPVAVASRTTPKSDPIAVSTLAANSRNGETRGYETRTSAGSLPQLEPPIVGAVRAAPPRDADAFKRPSYGPLPTPVLGPPER